MSSPTFLSPLFRATSIAGVTLFYTPVKALVDGLTKQLVCDGAPSCNVIIGRLTRTVTRSIGSLWTRDIRLNHLNSLLILRWVEATSRIPDYRQEQGRV